jgi:hypothetical protein
MISLNSVLVVLNELVIDLQRASGGVPPVGNPWILNSTKIDAPFMIIWEVLGLYLKYDPFGMLSH